MQISVVPLDGDDAGQRARFSIDPAKPVVIGRSEDCEIPLWDEAASRRHALLESRPDGLWVVDLGSANGTWIEDDRIDRRLLQGGEVIRIGESRLRIETPNFRRRDTAVIRPDESTETLEVTRRVAWDAVDLGAEVSTDADRAHRLNALLDAIHSTLEADGGESIIGAFLEGGRQLIGAAGGCVVPCAARTGEPLWTEVVRSSPPERAPEPSRGLLERVLEERSAIVVADPVRDPQTKDRQSIVTQGASSWIAAPIVAHDRIHAVAIFAAAPGAEPFGAEDLALAATLGRLTGLALAAAERLETSRHLLRVSEDPNRSELITHDAVLLDRISELERFSEAGGPLCIVGETGTGKELLARHAHRSGPHPGGPWIAVNCAALPAGLLESELFGHEEGAFTGATRRRTGMFELADRGTIFLDEIGELPLDLQPKLLRALESGEFFRIGGTQPVHVEVMVVSATHQDLEARVADGSFREDLLYRMARFQVEVPPLRDRPDDLEPIATAFLENASRTRGVSAPGVSPAAWEALRVYRWPGNVRELRNVIERATVLAGDRALRPEDLALRPAMEPGPAGADATPSVRTLREAEESAVRAALLAHCGRRGDTARALGVSEPTLRRKLRSYGLDRPSEETLEE